MPSTSLSIAPPRRAALAAAVAMSLLAGCGEERPATYTVQGKVVFPDGTPVTGGAVEFQSVESRINARGTIQPDGRFRLSTFEDGDGAVAGRHRAVIVQLFVAQADRAIRHDHLPGERNPRAIHSRHARYETSELEFDVSAERRNEIIVTVDPAE